MQLWFTGIVFSIAHGLLKVRPYPPPTVGFSLDSVLAGWPPRERGQEAAKPDMGGEELGGRARSEAPELAGGSGGCPVPIHHRHSRRLDPGDEHRLGQLQ